MTFFIEIPMKKTFFTIAAALLFAGTAYAGSTITGAGATFPYPIYAKWAHQYNQESGIKLNYQSIGSGGGVKQIKANTVDFGASDAPLTPKKLNKAGLVQFPMIMGGVVPVVNVAGIKPGDLKLSGDVLADIYAGKIAKWNDPAITALNPGVSLPAKSIAVIHRADGSGTTWIFTNYLTKVSENWKENVGNAKAVQWPVGVGGKGNEGVAAFVHKLKHAIGYVEYAYAKQNNMAHVLMQNKDGHFIAPTAATFQAAANGADWAGAEGYYVVLTNQPGAQSWPITGASFILMHKKQRKPERAGQVLNFFDWAYTNGSKSAMALDYVPMPAQVADLVRKTWTGDIKGSNGEPIWHAK